MKDLISDNIPSMDELSDLTTDAITGKMDDLFSPKEQSSKLTREDLIKDNQAVIDEATEHLVNANPVPDPNEVEVTGESLTAPASKDSRTAEIKVVSAIPEPQQEMPKDQKLFNPSKLERLWKDRTNLLSGKGLHDELLTNALSGFNHRIVAQQMPVHRQLEGYAFVTRIDANMTLDNIANSRFFSDLAAEGAGSIGWSILAALDAECELTNPEARYGTPCYEKVPFDNLQAFLPMFTNHVKEVTGFPDQTLDIWMSEEGAYREQYGMVDSVYEVNNGFPLNMTTINAVGEPISLYVRAVMEWSSGVRRGLFKPKTYNQIARRIDYQSRIYIFKFDGLGKRIINWGAGMVAWPLNDNEGSLLNFNNLVQLQDNTKELSIQWQCIGARYRDTLLFESFNEVVSYFNPDLIPDPTYDTYVPIGGNGYVEIPQNELHLFNWKGYPIIDTDTRAFRWYVPIHEYERILEKGGFSNE